jgi:hypothetical protein
LNKDGHGRGNWGQPIVDDIKASNEEGNEEGTEKKVEDVKEVEVVPKSKEELEEEKA